VVGDRASVASGHAGLQLTYLDNAGCEITDGHTVILVDPFLSQFARYRPAAPGSPASSRPAGAYDLVVRRFGYNQRKVDGVHVSAAAGIRLHAPLASVVLDGCPGFMVRRVRNRDGSGDRGAQRSCASCRPG
jgi:hypothetical protein